jgi:hypothetical protein
MSAIPVPLSILAAAAWLSLAVATAGFAASPPAPAVPTTNPTSPAPTASQPPLGANAAAAGAPAVTPAAAPGSDAAKHAKRTACLKDAKSKKLVGAEKNAFVKNCAAASPPASPPASAPLSR